VYVNSVPWVRIPPRPSEHKIRSTVSENYDPKRVETRDRLSIPRV
jgi:hypothetical protein